MDKIGLVLIAAGLTLLVGFPHAPAQVTQIQGGRALDANYGVGTGGVNTARPTSSFDSQLYITGQVTGLSRFRGRVGYAAPEELRSNIPSSALDSFRRQSVGLEEAIGSEVYRPSPYYGRTTTVLSVPKIIAGGSAPGTSMPRRTTLTAPVARRLYLTATADYASIAVLRPQHMILATPLVRSHESFLRGLGGASVLMPAAGEVELYRPPGRLTPGRLQEQQSTVGGAGESAERQDQVDLGVDNLVKNRFPGISEQEMPAEPGPGAAREATGRTPWLEPDKIVGEPGYGWDQDVFLDVLIRINQLRAWRQLTSGVSAPAGPISAGLKTSEGDRERLVEIVGKGLVIKGLAGKDRNILNAQLAAAGKKLKAGKFYDAAAACEAAIEIAPTNPLPCIGAALSLFAAGEPYSAALYLSRAMELFPPIMEIKVDLSKILGTQLKVWETRMLALDKSIELSGRETEPMLRFLAAYANYQLGMTEKAKAHAAALADVARTDKILSAYARFILTGKRPENRNTGGPVSKDK
ncbi:MAG: hypothetical protein ACYTF6_01535 [Planctomycetota bacterium]|jgi:hypothetical protein